MKSEIDDLLNMVDEWKFKLYQRLKKMTPDEEAAFWKNSREKARARGYNVVEAKPSPRAGDRRTNRRIG